MISKQINANLKKQGRKKNWLAEQMDMHRKTLWQKIKDKTLSADEENKIKLLLEIK